MDQRKLDSLNILVFNNNFDGPAFSHILRVIYAFCRGPHRKEIDFYCYSVMITCQAIFIIISFMWLQLNLYYILIQKTVLIIYAASEAERKIKINNYLQQIYEEKGWLPIKFCLLQLLLLSIFSYNVCSAYVAWMTRCCQLL